MCKDDTTRLSDGRKRESPSSKSDLKLTPESGKDREADVTSAGCADSSFQEAQIEWSTDENKKRRARKRRNWIEHRP